MPRKKCTFRYLAAMLSRPISQNRFTACSKHDMASALRKEFYHNNVLYSIEREILADNTDIKAIYKGKTIHTISRCFLIAMSSINICLGGLMFAFQLKAHTNGMRLPHSSQSNIKITVLNPKNPKVITFK